jgi:hypothetical protein
MKHSKQMFKFASSTLTGIAVFGITLLVSTSLYAATPTCHQKITVAGTDHLMDSLNLRKKVDRQVKGLALALLSSDPDDYDTRTMAYLEAVIDAAKVPVTEETAELVMILFADVTKGFANMDRAYGDNRVTLDGTKKSFIDNATTKILTAYFACDKAIAKGMQK